MLTATKITELKRQRSQYISQAREVWTRGTQKAAGPSAEDRQDFDRLMRLADETKEQYARHEQLEAAERSLTPAERSNARRAMLVRRHPDYSPMVNESIEYRGLQSYRELFNRWMTGDRLVASDLPAEFRDTLLGTDTKGGFLATPVRIADEYVATVTNTTFVRQIATVIDLPEGKSLGAPQVSGRMANATWSSEIQANTEDTSITLGRRDLTPNLLPKFAKASIRVISASEKVQDFLYSEMAYSHGVTEEAAYMTGDGSGKPLGVFIASANGIPTGRDISTGNTTTAIGLQNLYEMKYGLKVQYRNDPSCRWVFGRTAMKAIMQLQDSSLRPVFQEAKEFGEPDRILGIPVAETEYAPSTFTTGLYVGLLGAFRYYWIVEAPNAFSIQRLIERYSDTNEIGYIARRWVDAAPVCAEAFVRSKLA
jgi:HK97 family phage major capsid protein